MSEGFVPPQVVRSNAKRGLELRKKYGRGGTAIGVARARDLSNGATLPLDTIKRMTSYFARHEVDKKGEGWGTDSAGYIAWLLWGGDAGWSWARGIVKSQEAKEKLTMKDLTTAYFEIIKADKRDDGTLMVYGKATDDSLDIDQQICDPVWLDRAMPEWFKSGGNIREQHSNIAAGVAKEYEKKQDGHYIHALVVDPISVKKVDTGVLKGFSIGIKSPRIERDSKAVNGRIIDGTIVEVSLVDRPANPNCQLVLAKSVNGETGVWKVEELIEKEEKKPNYAAVNAGGGGSEPADKELYNRVKGEAKAKFDVYPSAYANAWLVREYKKRGGTYKKKTSKGVDNEDSQMNTAVDLIKTAKSLIVEDIKKFDQKLYDSARTALAQLIVVEANEMANEDSNEEMSISNLLAAVHHLFAWYSGEEAEGEVVKESIEMSADTEKLHHEEEKSNHDKAECDCEGCVGCKDAGGCAKSPCKMCMMAKSAESHKCLECGCGIPEDSHGRSDVTTADIVAPSETPKSAELTDQELPKEDAVEETPAEQTEVSAEEISAESIEAIVEKAVKSATDSVRSEVASLLNAKEALETKAATLESELATAKSLAIGGGPKRTLKPIDASNDLLTKALVYKQKANATTDPLLAKGYKALYEEYLAKSNPPEAN